jgi:cardiolipin synthase A/B
MAQSLIHTLLWWVVGGCLTAIICVVLVLYFRGTFRDRVEYKVKNAPSPEDARFPLALASLSNSVMTSGRSTNFWLESEQINSARLEAIRSAERTIHFETFFMTPGRRANDFATAIAEKAQAGVKVQVIADKYGVKTLPQRYWKRLKAAGIEVRFFNDFNWRSPIDYFARSHRKLLIIDGEFALIGGAGVSDYWDGKDNIRGTHPWYDFETRLEGEVVAVLAGMFMQHWTYVHGTADLSTTVSHPGVSSDPTMLVTAGDDPSYRSASVKALFQVSIHAARQRLWIASPYFLADKNIRIALTTAKKRGVDVKILTNGIRSDKKFVYFASCEQYRDLLAAGVEIYEYQPSMMHAKALLLDDRWLSTGSANFDPRSFFHNDELDISTSDLRLVKRIEQFLQQGFAKSKQVSFSEWRKRPLWQRALAKIVLFFESQL